MLLKCCAQYATNLGNSAMAKGLEKITLHSNLKEGQCQRMFKLPYNCTHFTCKVMLKILQTRLQQYVNQDLPEVQPGIRKGRGIRDQFTNICWIIEKAKEFQKNIYFCFTDYATAFGCVDYNKSWKSLRDGNTRPSNLPPEELACRTGSNS